MNSSFKVHNIKISLKLELPCPHYFFKVLKESKNINYKKFGNFIIVYSYYTFVFFNTSNKIIHCNVTKIKKYNEIYQAKKILKNTFSNIIILSTKVDNICGTRKLTKKLT